MSRLDEFLPEYDMRERHERRVPGTPELAVAAALGIPVAPLRRSASPSRRTVSSGRSSACAACPAAARCPARCARSASSRSWRSWIASCSARPAGRGLRARGSCRSNRAGPGQIRLVFDITATAIADGAAMLATETRVAAMDARSRRAFRAYWLAVGPFSALIRRHWLAAAERALR